MQEQFNDDWQAALSGEPAALNTPFRRQLRSSLEEWAARVVLASSTEDQRAIADFAETCRVNRQQDRQTMLTLFDRIEQRHQAEHINLRRAVETVALVAADDFGAPTVSLGNWPPTPKPSLFPRNHKKPVNPLTL